MLCPHWQEVIFRTHPWMYMHMRGPCMPPFPFLFSLYSVHCSRRLLCYNIKVINFIVSFIGDSDMSLVFNNFLQAWVPSSFGIFVWTVLTSKVSNKLPGKTLAGQSFNRKSVVSLMYEGILFMANGFKWWSANWEIFPWGPCKTILLMFLDFPPYGFLVGCKIGRSEDLVAKGA